MPGSRANARGRLADSPLTRRTSRPIFLLMSNSSADVASALPARGAGSGSVPPPAIAAARARFSSLQGDFVFLDAPGGTHTPAEAAPARPAGYEKARPETGPPTAP